MSQNFWTMSWLFILQTDSLNARDRNGLEGFAVIGINVLGSHGGVPVANVNDCGNVNSFQSPVQRASSPAADLIGTKMKFRLIKLDDIGACGLQCKYFLIDCAGSIHAESLFVGVILVDNPAGSGQRSNHSHLDRTTSMPLQETQVIQHDRTRPGELPHNPC